MEESARGKGEGSRWGGEGGGEEGARNLIRWAMDHKERRRREGEGREQMTKILHLGLLSMEEGRRGKRADDKDLTPGPPLNGGGKEREESR